MVIETGLEGDAIMRDTVMGEDNIRMLSGSIMVVCCLSYFWKPWLLLQ